MPPSTAIDALHLKDVADHISLCPSSPIVEQNHTLDKDTLYVHIPEERNPEKEQTADNYSKYVSDGQGLDSTASMNPDGRISVSFNLKKDVSSILLDRETDVEEFGVDKAGWRDVPPMNIVIMIVGSRGDVQPYVALGQQLVRDGHRIRIATHETFRPFVTDAGLEFFRIGGNPQDLMSYMVKNPRLVPGITSLTNGDIRRKRKMLTEMISGCWQSCHSPDPMSGRTFIADAIISNPPSFAHIHCAEALGIPLLLSFTMPWSPTTAFPQPLVNITSSNAGYGLSNCLSYVAADLLTWQGVGDIINTFRTSTLGLSPLTLRSGTGLVDRLRVPWTYCMSPALVPKPDDWRNHIDVVGFYFLDLASNYQPSVELAAFLDAGEAPVYIGFGSVVVDDPAAMSSIIFEATEQAGVRALVSAGWGGLGGVEVPPHVFMLGNVPHDWLFDKERVSAVVHHGGAGTTAIGLAKGRPTVVVPFFGDQGFWGNMIHKAGAGPKPIPQKQLNAQRLADAIKFAISPEAKVAAGQLAQKIEAEDGVRRGVASFYQHLPLLNMRCDLDPSRVAVWWSAQHCMKFSAFAAQTLADAKLLSLKTLVPHRPKEYGSHKKITETQSPGGASGLFWKITHSHGISDLFVSSSKSPSKPSSPIPTPTPTPGGTVSEGFPKSTEDTGMTQAKDEIKEEDKEKDNKNAPPGSFEHFVADYATPATKKEVFLGAIKGTAKHIIQTKLGLVTLPMLNAWKVMQSESGKAQVHRLCLTRLEDGKEAVQASTKAQRTKVIANFKQEITQTPQRRKLYQEALDRAREEGLEVDVEQNISSGQSSRALDSMSLLVPLTPSPQASGEPVSTPGTDRAGSAEVAPVQDEDGDVRFVEEMELAMKLSLEEYQRTNE